MLTQSCKPGKSAVLLCIDAPLITVLESLNSHVVRGRDPRLKNKGRLVLVSKSFESMLPTDSDDFEGFKSKDDSSVDSVTCRTNRAIDR